MPKFENEGTVKLPLRKYEDMMNLISQLKEKAKTLEQKHETPIESALRRMGENMPKEIDIMGGKGEIIDDAIVDYAGKKYRIVSVVIKPFN
jgi:hypothetical protein